jgi:hypothetical protein
LTDKPLILFCVLWSRIIDTNTNTNIVFQESAPNKAILLRTNGRASRSPAIQIHNLVRFPAIAYAGRAAIRGMSDMERPLLADTVEKVLFGV